jgi:FkbM family methyltransferase
MSHFLTYGNLTLLNVEGCKAVYDEVLVEDCYRREQIPQGAIVLDVGGFGGEFGIWCAKNRNARVRIYEPSPLVTVSHANNNLNGTLALVLDVAIAKQVEKRLLNFLPETSWSSRLAGLDHVSCAVQSSTPKEVQCLTLPDEIEDMRRDHPALPIVVKLDCEGAESEIFEDESWLSQVAMVLMEFHNQDGEAYRKVLRRHGFKVETNEPNPDAWRGLIYARK